MGSDNPVMDALLARHGTTFCAELGVDPALETPAPLFQWLVAANLFSTQISHKLGMKAAKALFEAGLTTPDKMAGSRWETRVKILNEAGYARMDEKYSAILGELAGQVCDDYDGDLRQLREAASQDPDEERRRLKALEGMGDTGVNIFFREVQASWTELYPFMDKLAIKAAKALELETDAGDLARGLTREDFVRRVAALTRAALAKDYDAIRDAA